MRCTAMKIGSNRSGVTPGSRGFLRPVRPDVLRPQACGPRRRRIGMQPTAFEGIFGMGLDVSPLIDRQIIETLKDYEKSRSRYIPVDVFEEADKFIVKADIPGASKEDIKVDVDDGIVNISVHEGVADGEDGHVAPGGRYIRQERTSSFAPTSIRVPDTANTDEIKATLSNGVISVTIPKKDEVVARKRSIVIE